MIDVEERRALWRLPISSHAKVLGALIADLQSLEHGACTMSLATLAAESGMSRSNVVRALAELRPRGLDEATRTGEPTRRTIDLTALCAPQPEPPVVQVPEPPVVQVPEPPVVQVPEPPVVQVPEPPVVQVTPPPEGDLSRGRLTTWTTGGSPPEPPVAHKRTKRGPKRGPKQPRACAPDLEDEIRLRHERYPAARLEDARSVATRSRPSGRMAGSVWLSTLRTLEAYPADDVAAGVERMLEIASEGELRKPERYLVGCVRGIASDRVNGGQGRLPIGTRRSRKPDHSAPPQAFGCDPIPEAQS